MKPQDADTGKNRYFDSGWHAGICGVDAVKLSGIRLLSRSRALGIRYPHARTVSRYRHNRSAAKRTHKSSNREEDLKGGPRR